MLRIDGLCKRYPNGPLALDDVSFTLEPGRMTAIIGRSGAGKSTLLRIISRLLEPDSGRIFFGSEEITRLRGAELRRWRARCAMVFQQFNLVGRLDALTNVLLGSAGRRSTAKTLLKWFTREERREALELMESLDILPQALQRVETLSGGQQQRVAIARALYQRPALLLADEPISSLDPHNATAAMEILSEIQKTKGIPVICNLHSLEYARRYCGHIVALAEGRVVYDGPAANVSETLYATSL
jgi:phosphonate transport system ATP-binding protein